jgi:hypothetical protein
MMLVAGAHPVLALHFCGNELYAFGISDSVGEPCCSSATKHDNADGLSQSHNSCCDIQKIKIATDDYQNRVQQPDLNSQSHFTGVMYFEPASTVNRGTPDNLNAANIAYPPGGLLLQHLDILTYICIFRI